MGLATVIKHFDAALGRLELCVTIAGELDASFEQLERLFESQVAILELLDELFELSQCRFKISYRGGRHVVLLTSQFSSPRRSVTVTASPGSTSAAFRIATERSAFQHTA